MVVLQQLSVNQTATGPYVTAAAYLDAPAANAFEWMRWEAELAGFTLDAVVEATRTWARQDYLHEGYVDKKPGFSLALSANAPSIHQLAHAIDWQGRWATPGTAEWNWRMANAPKYGFIWTGKNFKPVAENWHDEWNGTIWPPFTKTGGGAMSYSFVPLDKAGGVIAVVSQVTGRRVNIASPYHLGLLTRLKSNMGSDVMLSGEMAITEGYLSAINPGAASVAIAAAAAAVPFTPAQIADMAKQIAAAIPAAPKSFTITGEAKS